MTVVGGADVVGADVVAVGADAAVAAQPTYATVVEPGT